MSTGTDRTTDYLIVGGGTAGSVVARRLLDSGFDVTILEAGPPAVRSEISEPLGAMALFGSEIDWGYATVPQKSADDRVLFQPRGKTLGGTTVLNGMVYVRGAAADYEAWAAAGATGWGWADVEPYFRKLEQYDGSPDPRRGAGGPLRVHANPAPSPLVRDFLAAAVQAGHPENLDYNAGDSTGASVIQSTVFDGKRVTAWTAYGEPAARSPQLQLLTGSTVHEIVIEEGRAVGARFHDGTAPGMITAQREVIVAAGTFGTPQLLLLSGIGPKEELTHLGIDLVVDLPGVGKNLRDQVAVPVVWEATEVSAPTVNGIEAHVISTGSADALITPDWQTVLVGFPYSPIADGLPPVGFTGLAILLHPHSAGSVTLASADPNDRPLIDPAILSDSRDLESLVDHLQAVRAIGQQPALTRWVTGEVQPGPSTTSREQLREFVVRAVDSSHHQVGTARMGTDKLAVVDPTLRVHGVQGLRVADASVMPLPPAGNTAGAVVMIGERAASFILAGASQLPARV